jgi:predicted lipid-binding transport protein (Tim44 family)
MLRSLVAFAALALALLLGPEDADARAGDGLSLGRKADGTVMAPVATHALRLASNDHTVTGQASSQLPSPGSLGGLFSRHGLIGGFAAGFLGAGPVGLLFGHGFVGELGSVASFCGLLLQLALIAMLGWLIWSWWTGRNQPAFSGLSPRQLADPYLRTRHELAPGIDSSTDADDGAGGTHSASA